VVLGLEGGVFVRSGDGSYGALFGLGPGAPWRLLEQQRPCLPLGLSRLQLARQPEQHLGLPSRQVWGV